MPVLPQNYPSLYDVTKGYSNAPAKVVTINTNFNAIEYNPSTGFAVDVAVGVIKNVFHLENQFNFYTTTQLNY